MSTCRREELRRRDDCRPVQRLSHHPLPVSEAEDRSVQPILENLTGYRACSFTVRLVHTDGVGRAERGIARRTQLRADRTQRRWRGHRRAGCSE